MNGARGLNQDKLIEEINAALEADFPGVSFNFSQCIQDNVEEAVSGIKGENSVKLISNDVVVLLETAEKIKAAVSTVRGLSDLAVFTSLGQPTLLIDVGEGANLNNLQHRIMRRGQSLFRVRVA